MSADSCRMPPHSIEAEQAVLGGLMLVPESWDRVADRIREEDFYRRDHRLIYRAISELAGRGAPCDAVTLGEWFDNQGIAEEIGGAATLIELANSTPSAANIAAYADIVRDRAVLRQLIDAGTEIVGDGYATEGRSTQEIVETAEKRVFEIAESGARGRRQVVPSRGVVADMLSALSQRRAAPGALVGVSSGLRAIDAITMGLQPSDLIIVAGRPSMGKTAMAVNVATSVAVRDRRPVLIASLESPATQLVQRATAALSRIDTQRLARGDLSPAEWARTCQAADMIAGAPLYFCDSPALSPVELRSRARRLHRENGDLGLVVIDYLQLMQVPGNKENRATEIAEISRGLKALAIELHVPVMALSQLNRSLENRDDKRPVMADLRESGAIEQDADVIMFIYRDEYYNKDSADKGLAEVIIGKQRNGPTGSVRLAYHAEYTQFEDTAIRSES